MWPHAQQGQPTASCWACGTLVHVPVVDGSASTAWQVRTAATVALQFDWRMGVDPLRPAAVTPPNPPPRGAAVRLVRLPLRQQGVPVPQAPQQVGALGHPRVYSRPDGVHNWAGHGHPAAGRAQHTPPGGALRLVPPPGRLRHPAPRRHHRHLARARAGVHRHAAAGLHAARARRRRRRARLPAGLLLAVCALPGVQRCQAAGRAPLQHLQRLFCGHG
jgi:hypothetical protein